MATRSYSHSMRASSGLHRNPSSETPQCDDETLTEDRSQWLNRVLTEHPELVATRERVLPWTGGYSFSHISHTDRTSFLSHIDRHRMLELIYQHLKSIGMYQTAETVRRESGHDFQRKDQPWDKTDLLLLSSLGVLPREDPWAIQPEAHHHIIAENLEEDFFASTYREDPERIYEELFDRDLNVIWKTEDCEKTFENMKAASLRYLIMFLVTSSNAGGDILEGVVMGDDDVHRFFLILHSITSSQHFFAHLMMLFDCQNMMTGDEEMQRKLLEWRTPLRRNIINLLKKWINFHGLFIGKQTIKEIERFLRKIIDDPESNKGFDTRIIGRSILDAIPRLTYGSKTGMGSSPTKMPIVPDPQIIFRPELKIVDPDPEEVARQITLMFHAAFKAVHSREFIVALGSQKASHQTPTLTEFFDFGKKLTFLCVETIYKATDKNQVALQLLEIAKKLDNLYNFAAVACILRALQCFNFLPLPIWNQAQSRKTLHYLSARCGQDLEHRDVYKTVVGDNFAGWEPTIPNLHTELKTEAVDCSPPFIDGLINWEKRWNTSRKTAILYRFQNMAYSFWPIPQIQNVISKGPSMSENQIEEALCELRRSPGK